MGVHRTRRECISFFKAIIMTATQLIRILQDYVRMYGDQFVVAADEDRIVGDINSVLLTDDNEIAITFIPD